MTEEAQEAANGRGVPDRCDAAVRAMMAMGTRSWQTQQKRAPRFGRPGFTDTRSRLIISIAFFVAMGRSRGSSEGLAHLDASWSKFPLGASEISLIESEFASAGSSQGTIELNTKDRTPSVPFITGDAFRQLCPFRCEEQYGCAFSYDEVQPGDCIFIGTTDLRTFETTIKYIRSYKELAPKIQSPHVVITHNGDLSTPDGDDWHANEGELWSAEFSDLLESPSLVGWFASNCNWKGNRTKPLKLHCIPIGIENRYNSVGKAPEAYFAWMHRRLTATPTKLLLAAFSSSSNKPLRNVAVSKLQAPWITRVQHSVENPGELGRDAYVRVLQDHHFIACPPGHGYDTHRLWEVLLAGAIPVVISTPMDSMYQDLPVLIVKDWAEVTEARLQSTLDAFRARRWNTRKIFFPWWRELVTNISRPHVLSSSTASLAPFAAAMSGPDAPSSTGGMLHPCSRLHDYLGGARCLLSSLQVCEKRAPQAPGKSPIYPRKESYITYIS